MLNPVWLNTFKTLIDVGHFTKTAEKLFMTQPGVSQHIRKLEESCGAALIQRDKKSFDITEAGLRVYQYAKRLESEEAELLQGLQLDDPYSGVCRLACSGALGLKLYPELLDLQATYSELITRLEVAPNHKIVQEVLSGDVDLGIVTYLPQPALFEVEEVGTDELCLFYPAQYQGITLDSIIALGLIEHPDVHHYLDLYLALCGEATQEQIDRRQIQATGYVNQLSQILLPVAQGLGFTVLPHSAVSQFARPEQLAIYPSVRRVEESLYLIAKKGRLLPARFEVITKIIRQALQTS